MTLYKKIIAEIPRAKKYKQNFIGVYERSFVTSLSGETIIDAIKDFHGHYNSNLVLIFDIEEEKIFKAKVNDNSDCRGYYNQSFYDDENNLIFNEDDLTNPIIKLKPSLMTSESQHGYIDRNGKFWECGFEGHTRFAQELFLSETVKAPDKYKNDYRAESFLDNIGWVKISSKRIHYYRNLEGGIPNKLNAKQKKAIIKYMDIIGDENYEFQQHMESKYEIEINLYTQLLI